MSRQLQIIAAMTVATASIGLVACSSPDADAARLAADSCGGNPSIPVSDSNQFIAGPSEIYFANPVTPAGWLSRAKLRAQLSARAAAGDAYWQPLADAWGIAEAAARTADQPELASTAADLKLSYAMVTKDAYCRIALTRIGTQLNPGQ